MRVLLPNRKLLFFEQQPLAALPDSKEGRRRLLYFFVEDAVKKRCALAASIDLCSTYLVMESSSSGGQMPTSQTLHLLTKITP